MSTIVRLDKIKSTAHLVSFEMATALENGRMVVLGDMLADGEGYVATAPVAVDDARMVFHASVPMGYDEPDFEDEFVLEAGVKGRGIVLEKGDIVTITDDGFGTAPAKGEFVVPQAGDAKLTQAVPAGTESVAGVCIAKELLAGKTASVIEVL